MADVIHSLRIAFVDLTFNWPPVGGCWIDTHHLIRGLQNRGAEVTLFTPQFQTYYPRGDIKADLPYPVVKIPFNRFTFRFNKVIKRFGKKVRRFKPDLVFITDGYHMKNHLLTAFGPEKCILRFYAYEMLCINLHYYRYHENKICDKGYFTHPKECHSCWFHRMPAFGRALQILLGWKETHPNLHFSQEYLGSLAFSEAYRQKLLENFASLRGAVVYNEFMKGKLDPFIHNVHMIPSGVDHRRFTPRTTPLTNEGAVKIFLPGRANDPLKGLDVLIQAGEMLAREKIRFEIHYTAAMDCEAKKPWLINRGWVDQEQLPALYREMDIVTVPSVWIEPFGITALEGMASGLPVVASRTGGLAQTIVDGETGIHVKPENANELAAALRKLIADPSLRARMGQAGRRRVETRYTWDTLIDTYYIPLIQGKVAAPLAQPAVKSPVRPVPGETLPPIGAARREKAPTPVEVAPTPEPEPILMDTVLPSSEEEPIAVDGLLPVEEAVPVPERVDEPFVSEWDEGASEGEEPNPEAYEEMEEPLYDTGYEQEAQEEYHEHSAYPRDHEPSETAWDPLKEITPPAKPAPEPKATPEKKKKVKKSAPAENPFLNSFQDFQFKPVAGREGQPTESAPSFDTLPQTFSSEFGDFQFKPIVPRKKDEEEPY